jgi:hypothetical protein
MCLKFFLTFNQHGCLELILSRCLDGQFSVDNISSLRYSIIAVLFFFCDISFYVKVNSILLDPQCFIKVQPLAETGCPPWEGGQANRKGNDDSKSSRG